MIWYRVFSLFGLFPWPDESIEYIDSDIDRYIWSLQYRYAFGIVKLRDKYPLGIDLSNLAV